MRPCGKDDAHLQLTLLEGLTIRKAIAFHQGALGRQSLQRADVLFVPARNEYMGRVTPQLQVKCLKAAQGSAMLPDDAALSLSLAMTLDALAARTPGEKIPVERITADELKRVLREDGGRGTLMIGWERSALMEYASLGCDTASGAVTDPRGFDTVLCRMDPARLTDCWRRVVLLDGDLLPGLPEMIRERCPNVPILALQPNAILLKTLQGAVMDRDTLIGLWKVVQRGVSSLRLTPEELCKATGLDELRLRVGLSALAGANMVRYTASPFRTENAWRQGDPRPDPPPQDGRIMQMLKSVTDH